MTHKFPSEIYQVCAVYGGEMTNDGDFTAGYADAVDTFIKARDAGRRPRVLAITFDFETNMPESVSDVTDEFHMAADATEIAAE